MRTITIIALLFLTSCMSKPIYKPEFYDSFAALSTPQEIENYLKKNDPEMWKKMEKTVSSDAVIFEVKDAKSGVLIPSF